jgi:hypothetical protein
MSRTEQYTKLALRELSDGTYIWVCCLTATADFYGWSASFPTITEAKIAKTGTKFLAYPPSRIGRPHWGGTRRYICRVATRSGQPAGATNCFRMSKKATTRDYVTLAQGTTADWCWMESPGYRRVSREQWLSYAVPAIVAP